MLVDRYGPVKRLTVSHISDFIGAVATCEVHFESL